MTDNDSRLLAEAYSSSMASRAARMARIAKRREGYPPCPRCHKGKIHMNMLGVKCCDNCGYRPDTHNDKDPMGENSLAPSNDIDFDSGFQNLLYVLQKKGLLGSVNMNSKIVTILTKSSLNRKNLDNCARLKFLGLEYEDQS